MGVQPPRLPPDVAAVAARADAVLRDAFGGRPVSTYVHGSLALGGYHPARSDIDVLVVVGGDPPVSDDALRRLGDRLVELEWPGTGVELSAVAASAALHPAPPWPYLLHVTTSPQGSKVIVGATRPGDADLLMHYVVARTAGILVSGSPVTDTVGHVEREQVLRYLADELSWAADNAGEAYCVLNAARASCYLHDGAVLSKLDGGRRAIERGDPRELLDRAIDVQEGRSDDRPPTPDAVAYLIRVRAEITLATTP